MFISNPGKIGPLFRLFDGYRNNDISLFTHKRSIEFLRFSRTGPSLFANFHYTIRKTTLFDQT